MYYILLENLDLNNIFKMKISLFADKIQIDKKRVFQLFSLVFLHQCQKSDTTTSDMHQIKTSFGQKHQLDMDNRHSNF